MTYVTECVYIVGCILLLLSVWSSKQRQLKYSLIFYFIVHFVTISEGLKKVLVIVALAVLCSSFDPTGFSFINKIKSSLAGAIALRQHSILVNYLCVFLD